MDEGKQAERKLDASWPTAIMPVRKYRGTGTLALLWVKRLTATGRARSMPYKIRPTAIDRKADFRVIGKILFTKPCAVT